MVQTAGLRRWDTAGDLPGAGLAVLLACLGGAGLWALALAGLPGGVPAPFGWAAALVPFAAGPAALCAGWGVLALWRAGRRQAAAIASGVAGAALLLGLVVGAVVAQPARLAIVLAIVVPLLVAYTADVAMLGWATRLGRRRQAALLALAVLPLAAAFLAWPAPLWGAAFLLPVAVATPLLAAAFLTGARGEGQPRGAPALASAFFALPLAVAGGVGLAATAGVLSRLLAVWLVPLLFVLGPPVSLLALVCLVAAAFLFLPATEAARPAVAVSARTRPAPALTLPEPLGREPALAAPPAPPAPVAWPSNAAGTTGTAGRRPAAADDERRKQAVSLLTDRFLDGALSQADYEWQIDRVLWRGSMANDAPIPLGAPAGGQGGSEVR